MENKLINFVWIFIGLETDQYIGELKKYCLVEYSLNKDNDEYSLNKDIDEYSLNKDNDFSLKLSNFTAKSFPWKPIDELNYPDTKTVNKMINDGKRFLFKVNHDKYAYICNTHDGKYIFNDEENKKIKDKLQELIYSLNSI